MTLARRKLTLQLTPLLDLMLIVFFLQYLQLRQREVSTLAAAEHDAARVHEDLTAAESTAASALREALQLREELQRLQANSAAAADQAAADRARADRLLERESRLGRIVAELFDIPAELIDQALGPSAQPGGPRTAADDQGLRLELQRLATSDSGRVIRHLLLYEELRKRSDVWDLLIDPQNVVTLNTGEQTVRLRLYLNDRDEPDIPRFEEEFIQLYRSLPEPKSLVVILLTYDRAARLIVTEALAGALPRLTRRLTDDVHGAIRFEYADLGLRAGAP